MNRVAVVVGGGISGLVTALRLIEGARTRGIPLTVRLFEASGRIGGVIGTVTRDGFLLEQGPDSLITNKPAGTALCAELGLGERLVGTLGAHRRSFVVGGGKLHPVPEGFYLLAPTAIAPFIASNLFSWMGKLRMGLDLVLPARRDTADETLASFVRRRLGQEALERIAQPMIAGIYTADPEKLSLAATMPQFLELERKYGSVIRGMIATGMGGARKDGTAGPRYGLFATLTGGLEELVTAVASRLTPGTVTLGARVRGLTRTAAGWELEAGGERIRADVVCIALPPPRTAEVVGALDSELGAALGGIPCSSAATVNLGYRAADVPHPLDGMGLVIPAQERTTMMACSFSSRKFVNRSPDGMVLLRAFVGGAMHTASYALDDAAMVDGVRRDLGQLLGIRAAPVLTLVSRHDEAMPQYLLGHLDRVATIERRLDGLPGLALAGNGYRGVAIPDCAASADRAANRLLDALAAQAPDSGLRTPDWSPSPGDLRSGPALSPTGS